jgi:hypothetical protein
VDPASIDDLFSQALEEVAVTEVIRPSAILGEDEARVVRSELAARDARAEGWWVATPSVWERYDRPWATPEDPGPAKQVGSMHVIYDSPKRYQITIYRAVITIHGHDQGWDVTSLCNEALGFAGLSLDNCQRADLRPPPPVFTLDQP